jgi:hypothetical protein
VARAKRTTARTDARRRFRLAQQIEDGELEGDAPVPNTLSSAGGGSAKAAVAPARTGFLAAFRNAYHRANVREDLPYLPSLLLHWSFWVPLLLMIGSGVAAAVAPGQPVVLFLVYARQAGLAELTDEQLQAAFLNGLIFSPPSGVLFCSLAAWYKRFLSLTNPNRGRRPQPKAKSRPGR